MPGKNRGLVHVYTGNGKGKTTCAAGLALRAIGQGMRVCFASFHKKPGCAEARMLNKLGADTFAFASTPPCLCKNTRKLKKDCAKAFGALKTAAARARYDLIILDEANVCVAAGLIKEKDMIHFLKNKPSRTEIVLTGRNAAPGIIAAADLVSDIRKIKHPFDSGIKARKGIEY